MNNQPGSHPAGISQLYPVWVVAKREIQDQFRDWRIIFPIVGLTLVFPFIMNWTAQQMLDFTKDYGATVITNRLVPFLLMIVGFFPISVSLVIALESFVGEKERGSIEPLLNTPLKDWQLYLGKLISSTVPPLVSSYLGMIVYMAGVLLKHIPMPEGEILLQILLLTTVQAVMMVSGAVAVSIQATSVRAANLLSSFIVIPTAFLIQWEALVMFWGNQSTLWWVVGGISVLTVLLMRIGIVHFQREELLGREIDVFKVKWIWGIFWKAFVGDAHNLLDWYLRIVSATLRRLALPSLIVTGLVIAGLWLGLNEVRQFPFLIEKVKVDQAGKSLSDLLKIWPLFQMGSVGLVWWQNLRVLLAAMALGLFSFGVLGVLPLFVTMTVTGYLVGILSTSGMQIGPLLALLLPHGILEIPLSILATAAVLEAGAILATPSVEKTIGEVWIMTLADWAKIMIGIVVPLLGVAAMIEVWVTPQIAAFLFGGS
jgi:uncharacterized membrane protein SpoIIM required for sporulation/ABC-type transport system involved in multi-copper enzyme maturation permease subunit